ncbi:ABC-type branched-subunit amino acid transport system substrate-binding protein [Allocatelliglobosispora scoriae]|uniref:ABC-type branched-subunit amino acid transport system substrate-binding protein n=1 Tax=Allocatelliglobosispora scoriae TaxID=643052 RepID=A0A841BL61_9ACTN|nr:hypothetical protein [Allocatelliglobosispora scoriae]MBB5867482.1 ABC-type branched-subunit amino acid transport system substrate-binding protein [Allocatelliglobosispora scoriae]
MPGSTAHGSAGSATPRDGARWLRELIDDIRARPTAREGDLPLPTLLFRGQADDVAAVADALGDRHSRAPQASVAVDPAVGGQPRYQVFAEVLRLAAEKLSSTAPRGEARIRFPLLHHVLWLISMSPNPQGTALDTHVKQEVSSRRRALTNGHGKDSMRANIRAYVEGPIAAWVPIASLTSLVTFVAWDMAVGPALASAGLALVGVLGQMWVKSRSWAGARRYRWFSRQPYGWTEHERARDRPTDVDSFAIRVVTLRGAAAATSRSVTGYAARRRDEAPAANDTLELLLVNAFLEDLRQAYERRLWKIWRRVTWTRTIYPAVLLTGRCIPLAGRIEEVRGQTVAWDPLLLMALPTDEDSVTDTLAPADASISALTRPEELDALWQAWTDDLHRVRRVGSRRIVRIDVEAEHAEFLRNDGFTPRPVRGKPFLSRLWVAATAAVALLAAPTVYVLAVQFGSCVPEIKRVPSGECIGIGRDGFVLADRLRSVTDHIAANNAKIMGSNSPYVTVYHFGAFSAPASPGAADDLLADAHGELVGAALLQDSLIDVSKDGTIPQLVILPVNAGSEYAYADLAVDAMLAHMDDDNAIGVIGANESRESVRTAIQRLSGRVLPVLPTAATYDELAMVDGNYLPSVFPLAPPNSEMAKYTANWMVHGIPPTAGLPPEKYVLPAAKRVTVVTDSTKTDLYATDLGADVLAELRKLNPQINADEVNFAGAASVESVIGPVCRSRNRPEILYYAGRSSQFGAFQAAAAKSCAGIIVIASDAVTEYITDRKPALTDSRIEIFYTPLASAEVWQSVPVAHRTPFYTKFRELVDKLKVPAAQQPSPVYAAMAYDAADAMTQAAKNAFRVQRAGDPEAHIVDRAGVALALTKLGPINGASGLVDLHGDPDGHHARQRPVMLIRIATPAKPGDTPASDQQVVAQCGQLYTDQPTQPDCPEEQKPSGG